MSKKITTSVFFQFFIGTAIATVLIMFDLLKAEPAWVRFLGLPAIGLIYLFFYFSNIDKIYPTKETGFGMIIQLLIYSGVCLSYAAICIFFSITIVRLFMNSAIISGDFTIF